MNQNPYAPPQAPVADAHEEHAIERPSQVVLAIKLAVISYLLGLVSIALSWSYYKNLQSPASLFGGQVFAVALITWLYSKIYQGRNWARIVLLVFTIIGLLFVPLSLPLMKTAPLIVKLQTVVGTIISLWIVWLLFFSPGKEWFRKPGDRVAATGEYAKRK
jgi:hypothetical protein